MNSETLPLTRRQLKELTVRFYNSEISVAQFRKGLMDQRFELGLDDGRMQGPEATTEVFNAFDVDGCVALTASELMEPAISIPSIEDFIAQTGALIRWSDERAYYDHILDVIRVPDRDVLIDRLTMTQTEAHYHILFHELVHWTGTRQRLSRHHGPEYEDLVDYAIEEAIAEIGAAYLCADLDVTTDVRQEHACYLTEWVPLLNHKAKLLFDAAEAASNAVKFLKERHVAGTAARPDGAQGA